ncbi:MAG TPA: cell division protein FtsB [Thiobacillaceae bacterium]|jgi:cell division protein FtsB|nr:cell division protein FtsB [Thiobacillaceae bacterium]HNH88013.1 cell division protein FtsB [Thiobacillaceae bacterium]HNI07418.1 cell division protein FtsB [Thiobacillaceae bacterium]
MRGLAWTLAGLILLLQFPLWFGKGSWLRVWELEREIAAQRTANQALEARNVQLAAEARDLHSGYDALDERARFELGMVRGNEVFFHVMESGNRAATEIKRP